MTEEEGEASQVMLIVPIIVAVFLVVVAVGIVIKCYQSRQKAVLAIQANLKAVAQTESGYVESQYQMRPEDGDKSDIFSRTSVANHKLRMADNVSGQDVVEDAFGASHLSVASSSASAQKFNSESKMSNEAANL